MADRPNVVLITTHDQGRYAGCYDRPVDTPNLDDIATEGARFDEYYCTAPQCSPSRASIVTGCYPHRTGMLGLAHKGWSLDRQETLPRTFGEAGYDTHLVGMQHEARDEDRTSKELAHSIGYENFHGSERVPATVAETFEEFLDDAPADPFYAAVGFFEPHRLGPDFEHGWREPARDPEALELPEWLPDTEGVRRDLAAFYESVERVDQAVGRTREALAAAGHLDDTILVFTTDHGVAFPRAKGECYDPGLETALMIRYPDAIEPGTTTDALHSNIDLAPTLWDLCDVDAPSDIDGRSMRPALDGTDESGRDAIYAELTVHDCYVPTRAVRTRQHKYIRNYGSQPPVYLPSDVRKSDSGVGIYQEYYRGSAPDEELYDLARDPHEQRNVADDAEYLSIQKDLADQLDDWMERTDDPLRDGHVTIPEIHREQMKWAS